MRRHRFVAVLLALSTLTAIHLGGGVPPVQPASATDPVPRGMGPGWSLTFDDEFDGTALNAANWSTGWFGSGITGPVNAIEPQCYDPAQVEVGGGVLELSLEARQVACGGRVRSHVSGMVTTYGKYHYTHGASEARIYLPADAAGAVVNWPAFWANGHNWPADGENDVMEAMDGEVGAHFHSPAGGPGFEVPGSWRGWHTFGSAWEPGQVVYFYDGRAVGVIREGVTQAEMYLILNYAGSVGSTPVAASMQVDYVRVWQR